MNIYALTDRLYNCTSQSLEVVDRDCKEAAKLIKEQAEEIEQLNKRNRRLKRLWHIGQSHLSNALDEVERIKKDNIPFKKIETRPLPTAYYNEFWKGLI